jgi:membrane-anchored glycerophosphoryl diester phosphodiesterase (GDPDase)
MTIWAVIIPVIVLERRSAGEAFARSRELVRGNGWNVFGLIVLMFLILIVAGIVLGLLLSWLPGWLGAYIQNVVSNSITAPFVAVALTLAYFGLREREAPVEPPPPVEEPPPVEQPAP